MAPDNRPEKQETQDETQHLDQTHTTIDVIHTTTALPYGEINFIGTYAAATLACTGAFATYVMPVTSLVILNELIGPSPNVTWVALAWTLLSAVSFTLLGRLSDIFGRRWFFTGSSALALLGSIIGATANHINTLIAASVFLGLASAGQLSNNYSVGELVPLRHRFAANGIIFLFTLPTSALGPYLARLFIQNTAAGWRGMYYLGIAIHGASTLCWILFYHPPRFQQLHKNRTKMDEIRDMDFGGIFLFTAGSVLFLLGLSWGGQLYPWSSGYTLGTLIAGFLTIIGFILYEIYVPLQRPLIPMRLFNFNYSAFTVVSCAGSIVYYSMSLLFPTMVATIFETDIIRAGLVSCAVGGGVCAGQTLGSWLAVPGGHMKLKMIFVAAGLTGFLGGMAGVTDNETICIILVVLAGFMVGLLELFVSTAVTVVIEDQSEIGTASGVFGSIRASAGVLATAIFSSILQNNVSSYMSSLVVPSIVQAGLPASSVPQFLAAFTAGQVDQLPKIPGVTPEIIGVAAATVKESYVKSFKIVYLATIAFGSLSVITAFAIPNIDNRLTNDVVRRLHANKSEESSGDGTDKSMA